MSSNKKRTKFTVQEIQNQLHQLHLYASLSSASENIDQLAPILVNIHRSRQQDVYLKQLQHFVAQKEEEIEAVCAANYQDFVGSVSALLKVRQNTVTLKHRVLDLNELVQKSGGALAEKKKALLDARRVGQNIDEAIDTLQSCLRVLDLTTRTTELADRQKYFSALRHLDDLQLTHLKPVQNYSFATSILNSIPQSRNAIRESVTSSLKGWMYEARNASQAVGKGALESMENRGRKWRRWAAKKRKEGHMGLSKINGPIELGQSERHEFNALDNDQVKIDFTPLYQCIQIYDTLDAREELQESYQADRKAQADLLLSQTDSLIPLSIQKLTSLLEEIVGFFLIESHVLESTNSFRSEQDVEDLWDGMCERVVNIVDEGLAGCEEPEIFLGTKFKVLTFVQTLEGYGYSVNQLNNLLMSLFERYSELLQRKFSGDFEQIVLSDDHQSMVVSDAEEFEKVMSVSWLPTSGEWSAAELRRPGFPLALPFSQTYPLCCIDIRSFAEQYYQFAEGFAEHNRDIDDVLRRALDNLLIRLVSENIQRRLEAVDNMSQLSQIVVNVLFFQTACSELESLLITMRATQRGGTIHLDSLASFKDTLDLTHNRIIRILSEKVDAFFEEAQYPWESTHPPRNSPNDPSPYLFDLTNYLSTVMMSGLVQLPRFSKDYVYRGALSHCADIFMSYLIDREPKKVTDESLSVLANDVNWIVDHISSMGEDKSVEVFTEVKQLLILLTATPNVMSYLNVDYRTTHFSRVSQRDLQSALIKLSGFYNTNAGLLVNPRRRAAIDELLKLVSR